MAIVEDHGLVLRSQRYRETSRIATVLTPGFGKVSLIAKGAREQKTPFGAGLEPLTQGFFVFYLKKERSLHLLKAAAVEVEYARALASPSSYYLCSAALEFAMKVLPDEDPSPEAYDALEAFLVWRDRVAASPGSTLASMEEAGLKAFQLQMVSLLGYAPQLRHCTRCGALDQSWAGFGVAEGGLVCRQCAAQGYLLPLSEGTRELLEALVTGAAPASEASMRWTGETAQELAGVVAAFLRYHVPGYQGLRALRGWQQWQDLARRESA